MYLITLFNFLNGILYLTTPLFSKLINKMKFLPKCLREVNIEFNEFREDVFKRLKTSCTMCDIPKFII